MKVIVIGAGAAGLMAAGQAAAAGAAVDERAKVRVTVLEKNAQPGKKLLLTGKGRCNITNTATIPDFIKNIPGQGQFLYGCLTRFNNTALIDFLRQLGLETKVERGGRVFPVSDRAADVVTALVNFCLAKGVKFEYSSPVNEILAADGRVRAVRLKNGRESGCDAVVLATGGSSYPGTGSTGDGYRMAAQLGHTITPLKAALVPLETGEEWVQEVQGLTLKNVKVTAWRGQREQKQLAAGFGEMLFTHFGVSGPVILTLSRLITDLLEKGEPVTLTINLKPALPAEKLDARLRRDFAKYTRKQFRNSLSELLPKSLLPVLINISGIPAGKPVHQVTREERAGLVELIQALPLTVTRPRPLEEAIVTAGGVSVKEINPQTMESKLVKGLYLAGEVVDVDGLTGGFNLQAAFSMGYVAGMIAARSNEGTAWN